jgi:hypothetical protein
VRPQELCSLGGTAQRRAPTPEPGLWRRFAVLAVAIAATLPALTTVGLASGGDELWSGATGESPRLVVVNEHGGVRVLPAREGTARVRGASSITSIEASAGPDAAVLTVRLRADLDEAPAADIEVLVPAGTDLSVRTGAGAVTVTGVAALGLASREVAVEIETVSGDVAFCVEPTASGTVELATSGEILVDFSVTVEHRYHQEPAKQARVVLGEGGARWTATSRLGRMSVLRADAGDCDQER